MLRIILAGMKGFWWTHVEMHFLSSLSWEEIGQHMLRYILSSRWFGQHMLRCILCSRWHRRDLVNACSDTFCVLPGMGWVWSTHVRCIYTLNMFGQLIFWCIVWPHIHGMDLVNTSLDALYVLVCMWLVLLTHVEMHFVLSQAWHAFVQPNLGGVWSTHVVLHFESSLSCDGFGTHVLPYILCPRWLAMRLVNTCWEAFCAIAGGERFGQLKFK